MSRLIDKEKVTLSRALPAAVARWDGAGALARLVRAATRSVRRSLRRAAIERELRLLDDRTLADIGIQRWDIDAVADRAAGEAPDAGPGFREELARVVREAVLEPLLAWRSRNAARRELMSLDDRMLRDIGISRADIPAVVEAMRREARRAAPAEAAADIIEPLRHWNRSRHAAKDLNTLDDRTLEDIGLTRGDIAAVAEELAQRSLGAANRNHTPRAA